MRKSMWKTCPQNRKCGKLSRCNCRNFSNVYKNINYKQLIQMITEDKNVVLLDVRSIQEFREGYINRSNINSFVRIRKEC